MARRRGDDAARERASDLFADLAARRTALAAEIGELEAGQVHALGALGAGVREKDLAARERELADREALRVLARRGLRLAAIRPAPDVAGDLLDVRSAVGVELEVHDRVTDPHTRDAERLLAERSRVDHHLDCGERDRIGARIALRIRHAN